MSMLSSLLGNFLNNTKSVGKNNSDLFEKRKLVIQKFSKFDSNDNVARARIAKELIGVSKTEGEKKAALKFYRDELAIYKLKQKIRRTASVNEKLRLAREARRLATKQQQKYWDVLIAELQGQTQKKTIFKPTKKKMLIKKQDETEEEITEEKEEDEDLDKEIADEEIADKDEIDEIDKTNEVNETDITEESEKDENTNDLEMINDVDDVEDIDADLDLTNDDEDKSENRS